MTMYRVQPKVNQLQPFRSIKFESHYLEEDLEAWLEKNPEVLTDGEPILVIGRQVNTDFGTRLDLLGLDAEGSVIVAELKRAPTRDIVAQTLEYAAWIDSLDEVRIKNIAEEYLAKCNPPLSFNDAWQQIFGNAIEGGGPPGVPADLHFNQRQRIIVVIEGHSDQIASVIRYLRKGNLDINLLEYSYYQTESGEEILDVELRVSQEEQPTGTVTIVGRFTEGALVNTWNENVKAAYEVFRTRLLQDERMIIAPQKSTISFYKQSGNGRVFVCYFSAAPQHVLVSLRRDSLRNRVDTDTAFKAIRDQLSPQVEINDRPAWFSLYFSITRDLATVVADSIMKHIASQLE